jgi:XRE family transcriptional regulator, regulator of sulfur utilization
VAQPKHKPILKHRKIIGEAIRHHRKQSGFTQEKLAEKVSLNPKYLGEVERGEKIISIEALLRVAKSLGVHPSDFLRNL